MAEKTDLFANLALVSVIQTAPNGIKFKKLESNISFDRKVAWVVHRIEYHIQGIYLVGTTGLRADKSITRMALTVANTMTSLSLMDNLVLDMTEMVFIGNAAATAENYKDSMQVKDFTSLPSGGIVVPPSPLYVAVDTVDAGGNIEVEMKIYYTILEMKPENYWDLVESRRVITN